MRKTDRSLLNCSKWLLNKRNSSKSNSSFQQQRKSALKVINAATNPNLKKSNGLDYSNNLSGNFTSISLDKRLKDLWWSTYKRRDVSPGDFIYVPKYGQLGVALSLDILEGRRVVYTLHSSGCVSTYPETSIVNATPLFQPSELDHSAIQAIVIDAKLNPLAQTQVYNPEHDTHSVYKAKLSARLKRLTFNVESTQQSLSHDLQELYAKIKNKDSLKWRDYDVWTVATRDLHISNPSYIHILALQMMLYRNTTEYNMLDNAASIQQMKFGVRPATEVGILKLVTEWSNSNHGRSILETFVEKSQILLNAASHTSKQPEMPTAVTPPVKYDDQEMILIRFITDSCQTLNTPAFNPYESLCCILLKNFAQYHSVNQENWRSLAFDFLQNVGMFQPWESIHMAGSTSIVPRDSHVDKQFERVSDMAMEEWRSITGGSGGGGGANANAIASTSSASPNSLHHRDMLETHRKDFGDLPVYVIDDAGANELDDGISIEQKDGRTWVHVHIADPTSVIPPTHPLALLARDRVTSLYLPHRTVPMLPKQLCMDGFSLGSGHGKRKLAGAGADTKNTNTAQPALTFSAQLDERGVIRDYNVCASLISNIQTLQYDAVDGALSGECENVGLEDTSKTTSNATLLDALSPRTLADVAPEHATPLQQLLQLATQQSQRRVENGMLFWQGTSPNPTVSPLPLPATSTQMLWEGRPSVHLNPPAPHLSPSRFLVSQMMGVACQVAALWGKERHVPGVYRGASMPESSITGGIKALLAKRDSITGKVSTQDVGLACASFTGGTLSSTPTPHHLNGCLEGYARVTSPLRRYSDMVMHWQFKSALLAQHSPKERVPWMYASHAEMEDYLVRCRQTEPAYQRISNTVSDYWVVRELKRRHEESDSSLYKHLTCTIVSAWRNDGAGTRSWSDCQVAELGNMSARLVRDYACPTDIALEDIGKTVKASAAEFLLYDKARLTMRLDD